MTPGSCAIEEQARRLAYVGTELQVCPSTGLEACRYRAGRGGDGWPATVDMKVNGRTLFWIAVAV